MGLILATVALGILGVLGACCSRILADEFKAWVPFFVERIISIAVGRAPEHFRERLAEEWRAYVNDKPGDLGKLCAALDLIRASAKSSSEALRPAARPSAERGLRDRILRRLKAITITLTPPETDHIHDALDALERQSRALRTDLSGPYYIDVEDPWPPVCESSKDGKHCVPNGALYFSHRHRGVKTFQAHCALCGRWIDTGEMPDD